MDEKNEITLIQKNPIKGNISNNYRRIKYLSTVLKILTAR